MIQYELRIEPYPKRLRITFNDALIADTTRALVLHETRHAPTFYIPFADVHTGHLERTTHRTHCPFKGDASYWTLRVGGAVSENAAWSYDDPFDDAAPLRQHLAFYPGRVGAIYDGDEEAPHLEAEAGLHGNSIAGWLLAEAWKIEGEERLIDGFCRCLQRAGVPVSRMTIIIPALHPQVFATVLVWRDDAGARTIHRQRRGDRQKLRW